MCFVPFQACNYAAFLQITQQIVQIAAVSGIVIGWFVFVASTEQRNFLLGILGIAAPCFMLVNIKRINGNIARWSVPFFLVGFVGLSGLGTVSGKLHSLKRARAEFRVLQNPRDDKALMAFAESIKDSRYGQAKTLARRALKLNPRNPDALAMVAGAASSQGRCIRLYERARSILAKQKRQLSESSLERLAGCYQGAGRTGKALPLYDELCRQKRKFACDRARHIRRMRKIRGM